MKKHLFLIVLVCTLLLGCKPDPVLPTVETSLLQSGVMDGECLHWKRCMNSHKNALGPGLKIMALWVIK